MSIEDSALALGIEIDDVKNTKKLKKEKRYYVIVHILRGKKSFIGSTPFPNANIKIARKMALADLEHRIKKVKKNDIVSIKCLEITYCDVPIDTVLKGVIYKMQPVSNRWMLPEEIEKLI
jgi:hypothetical protein